MVLPLDNSSEPEHHIWMFKNSDIEQFRNDKLQLTDAIQLRDKFTFENIGTTKLSKFLPIIRHNLAVEEKVCMP